MKLTQYSCPQTLLCSSEKEMGDLVALLELLGLSWFSEDRYDFEFAPYIMVCHPNFQQTSNVSTIKEWNSTAEEFIRDNF